MNCSITLRVFLSSVATGLGSIHLSFNNNRSFSSLPSFWKTTTWLNWFLRMERFSLCVCVCVCVFHRVVGPAVTFKVSPNTQNVTTADVANVAGRYFLGSLMLLLVALLQKKRRSHYQWLSGAPEAPHRLRAPRLFECFFLCVFILPHANWPTTPCRVLHINPIFHKMFLSVKASTVYFTFAFSSTPTVFPLTLKRSNLKQKIWLMETCQFG